jgi:hypothetical protein
MITPSSIYFARSARTQGFRTIVDTQLDEVRLTIMLRELGNMISKIALNDPLGIQHVHGGAWLIDSETKDDCTAPQYSGSKRLNTRSAR